MFFSTIGVPGWRRNLRVGLAVMTLGLSLSGCGGGNGDNNAASNVVYLESNDPTSNTIIAYSRAADGSVSPLSGSPIDLRGQGLANPTAGVGPPDGDSQIVASSDKKYIFCVNAGSSTIAALQVASNGGLTHVPGSPFASGGVNPISLNLLGNRLYCANKNVSSGSGGAGTPTFTVFNVAGNGTLTQIPGTVAVSPAGSSAAQILSSPDGKTMFTNDFLGPTTSPASGLRSYSINADGSLTQVGSAQSPPSVVPPGTAAGFVPLYSLVQGVQVHPTQRVFYACTPITSKIAVYTYDVSGALTFKSFASVSGVVPCWLFINKAGTRMYVGSTGDNSVSVMDISNPQAPQEIQRLALKDPGPTYAFLPILPNITSSAVSELTLDPSEQSLYVISHRNTATAAVTGGNMLHVLHVNNDGTVTEPGASVATGVSDLAFMHGILAL